MANDKKAKKQARKERQEQLKLSSQRVHDKLIRSTVAGPKDVTAVATGNEGVLSRSQHIIYVLPPSELELEAAAEQQRKQQEEEEAEAQRQAAASALEKEKNEREAAEEDGDRVELPAVPGAGGSAQQPKSSSVKGGRKYHRIPWEKLKVMVAQKYGLKAAEKVSEHDGNAPDPLFTVKMKLQPRSVPVPGHWVRLRSFLALQSDREEAVSLVPPEIEALGIAKIRGAKDKKANLNQTAFITCFLTGTPLQKKTFGVTTTAPGQVFYEGRWHPQTHFTPGVLSPRLRQALGMGPSAPPPWLYAMQRMRRLPPAYPTLRVPGLNAPIPSGAQWGMGQGQWGEPPRGADNSFLFSGVMDETTAVMQAPPVYWGSVPPLEVAAGGPSSSTPSGAVAGVPATPQRRPPPTGKASASIAINPVPFQPQSYLSQMQQQMARPMAGPQEYVRVQDSSMNTTVALGHVMKAKGTEKTAPPPPPPPQRR